MGRRARSSETKIRYELRGLRFRYMRQAYCSVTGKTVPEFAALFGVRDSTMYSWEGGTRPDDEFTVTNTMQGLGLSVPYYEERNLEFQHGWGDEAVYEIVMKKETEQATIP